LPNADNDS
jgi:hypothetical protein